MAHDDSNDPYLYADADAAANHYPLSDNEVGMGLESDDPDVTQPQPTASQPPPLENPVEVALKKNRDDILCE